MNRRFFLRALGLAAAAPLIPTLPVSLLQLPPKAAVKHLGVITTGTFAKALWPGIHKFWGDVYNDHALSFTPLFEDKDKK